MATTSGGTGADGRPNTLVVPRPLAAPSFAPVLHSPLSPPPSPPASPPPKGGERRGEQGRYDEELERAAERQDELKAEIDALRAKNRTLAGRLNEQTLEAARKEEASTAQYERRLAEERRGRAEEVRVLNQKVAWHVHNQVGGAGWGEGSFLRTILTTSHLVLLSLALSRPRRWWTGTWRLYGSRNT